MPRPWNAEDMPDCCEECGTYDINTPTCWHDGTGRYTCPAGHRWTCGWGHDETGAAA